MFFRLRHLPGREHSLNFRTQNQCRYVSTFSAFSYIHEKHSLNITFNREKKVVECKNNHLWFQLQENCLWFSIADLSM